MTQPNISSDNIAAFVMLLVSVLVSDAQTSPVNHRIYNDNIRFTYGT